MHIKRLILPLVAMTVLAGSVYYYLSLAKQALITGNENVQAVYSPASALGENENGRKIAESDLFGTAVALHGNLMLVGAPTADHKYKDADEAGIAYLLDVRTGELLQTFAIPQSVDETSPTERLHQNTYQGKPYFGIAVALNDRYALVGAPRDQQGDGAAYLFDLDTGGFVHRFTNPDMVSGIGFGWDVALSNERALFAVGSVHPAMMYEGAFLFDLADPDKMIRLPTAQIDVPLAEIDAIALNDRYAVLARSYNYPVSTSDYDAIVDIVQVFDTCTGKLTRTLDRDTWFENEFGAELSLHGDHLLVAAPNNYSSNKLRSMYGLSADGYDLRGAAFLHDLRNGEVVAEFRGSDEPENDKFGHAVALNGTHALVQDGDGVVLFDRFSGATVFTDGVGSTPVFGHFGLSAIDGYFAIGAPGDVFHGAGEGYGATPAGAVFKITIDESPTASPPIEPIDASNCQAAFLENAESARAAAEMTLAAYAAIFAYMAGEMSFEEASALAAIGGVDQFRFNRVRERAETSDMQRLSQELDEIRDILNGLN